METYSGTRRTFGLMPDLGLLLIRLMAGVVFIYHGSQKLFAAFGGPGLKGFAGFLEGLGVPMPSVSAFLAGSAEFFGGVAILTGVGMRLLSAPLAFTMLVACFTVHAGKFSAQHGGMEYPLTLAVLAAGLGLTGPGRFALINVLRRKKLD